MRKKHPVLRNLLLDAAAAGLALTVFALFHHVLPSEQQSLNVQTVRPATAQAAAETAATAEIQAAAETPAVTETADETAAEKAEEKPDQQKHLRQDSPGRPFLLHVGSSFTV